LRVKDSGVIYAKIQNISAQGKVLGRKTAAAGVTEEVAMDDSTIELIAGGSIRVKDGGITYSKIQNISATSKILGRKTTGAGVTEEIDCTPAAQSILDDTTVGAIRTTLGVGTGDSPTFNNPVLTGLTVGSLAGFLFGTAGAMSALAAAARVKIGSATHDVSLTGAGAIQAITGVGFVPSAVIILAVIHGTKAVSIGFGTAADGGLVIGGDGAESADVWLSGGANMTYLVTGAGIVAYAPLTSLDAGGFTITWAKAGSPTGTATILYLCLR
jgi:hypothetical protein